MKKSISLILVALVLAGCSFFQRKKTQPLKHKRRLLKAQQQRNKQRQVLLKLQRLSLQQLLKHSTQRLPFQRLYLLKK